MLFASLFGSIYGLYEILEAKKKYTTVNYITTKQNTVQFFTANLFGLAINNMEWKAVKTRDITIRLEIYVNNLKVFSDSKPATDPNFFYTTSSSGKHYIVFTVSGSGIQQYKKLGLDGKTFSGEESMPVIVSNGDVELNNAEAFVKRVLEYAKKNLALQDEDFEDDKTYRGVYDGILKIAVSLMILKVFATVITLYYSNWKTKKFFVDQNVQ